MSDGQAGGAPETRQGRCECGQCTADPTSSTYWTRHYTREMANDYHGTISRQRSDPVSGRCPNCHWQLHDDWTATPPQERLKLL